jgi:hypothetical protein
VPVIDVPPDADGLTSCDAATLMTWCDHSDKVRAQNNAVNTTRRCPEKFLFGEDNLSDILYYS